MKYVLIAFFIVVSCLSFSQKRDTLVLGEIKQSFCLAVEKDAVQLLGKSFNNDTLNLKFMARINCAGFHHPVARISGDSLLIHFDYGGRVLTPWKKLSASERKYYADQGADTNGTVEQSSTAACDCIYIFDMKITGLNPNISYCCYFNERYLGEPTEKTAYKYYVMVQPDRFNKKDFEKEVTTIVEENSRRKKARMSFDLVVDPETSKVEALSLRVQSTNKRLEEKLVDYLKENIYLTCLVDPITGIKLTNYILNVSYEYDFSNKVSYNIYCPVVF